MVSVNVNMDTCGLLIYESKLIEECFSKENNEPNKKMFVFYYGIV